MDEEEAFLPHAPHVASFSSIQESPKTVAERLAEIYLQIPEIRENSTLNEGVYEEMAFLEENLWARKSEGSLDEQEKEGLAELKETLDEILESQTGGKGNKIYAGIMLGGFALSLLLICVGAPIWVVNNQKEMPDPTQEAVGKVLTISGGTIGGIDLLYCCVRLAYSFIVGEEPLSETAIDMIKEKRDFLEQLVPDAPHVAMPAG